MIDFSTATNKQLYTIYFSMSGFLEHFKTICEEDDTFSARDYSNVERESKRIIVAVENELNYRGLL